MRFCADWIGGVLEDRHSESAEVGPSILGGRVKPLRCLFGLHSRNHCRCDLCGTLRDRDHDWRATCTCAVCGTTRNDYHERAGCQCVVCGTALHDFQPAGPGGHICQRCHLEETHTFEREFRWEDWGGWDSIGSWSAQENVYRVCCRCRYEEYVGFTGMIQV